MDTQTVVWSLFCRGIAVYCSPTACSDGKWQMHWFLWSPFLVFLDLTESLEAGPAFHSPSTETIHTHHMEKFPKRCFNM